MFCEAILPLTACLAGVGMTSSKAGTEPTPSSVAQAGIAFSAELDLTGFTLPTGRVT
jgi:hypothetical protein